MRLVTSSQAANLSPSLLGGKGANLARLGKLGLPVPPWLCLTTSVWDELAARAADELEAALDQAQDQSPGKDASGLREASARLSELVRRTGLSPEDVRALGAAFDQAFPPGTLVAVRSSVVGEDSEKDSFAGQMETVLCVPKERLEEAVLTVLASAFSERALLYRRLRGKSARGVQAAVLVQQMVDSRVSGILFTANPTTSARDEMVVSAGLGLGEGIVGGLVEADTFFLHGQSGAVLDRVVAEKSSQVVRDAAAGLGTKVVPVEGDAQTRPCLDDQRLEQLASIGRRLEEALEAPQDVEWAVDAEGRLLLLQTRPITTLGARETVFDNANIVESYPGISSPLSFSFVRPAYAETFTSALRHLRVPDAVLAQNRPVLDNLVAYVDGRIYYNILNWYALYQLVPGFERYLPAWEKALGLTKRFVRPRPPPSSAERRRLARANRRAMANLAVKFFGLERDVAAFFAGFSRTQAEFAKNPLERLDAHGLLDLLEQLNRAIAGPYGIAVVNDFYTQQLHELVSKLIERWKLGDREMLRNELLCGEHGMESVEPVHSLLAVVEAIRKRPELEARFLDAKDDAALWAWLQTEPDVAALREQLRVHLERYGDRTLHELKLETPSLDENPAFVLAMVRNYLNVGRSQAALQSREQEIRARAEEKARSGLAGHPVRAWLFWKVLGYCRRGVRYRENLRLARTRAYGMAKRIYRALARHLVEASLLERPEDVFFLTTHEVHGAVRGHLETQDPKALVRLRREDLARYRERSPAPRLSVRGVVYARPFESAKAERAVGEGQATLKGIGCSPGTARAAAKVILEPTGDLDIRGQILVAPMTDPGWVFLMVASSGIIAERGSVLSHTAIIGRELGIPTVVGVKHATRLVQTGAELEIDGAAGTVRVLSGEQ